MSEPLITWRDLEREMNHRNERLMQAEERIERLQASVRNQAGDNLCWFDPATTQIPPQSEFLESCRRYHAQILEKTGVLEGSRTIAQLEARVAKLEAELNIADGSNDKLRLENTALRKALDILAKRQCGSFCTEKDKDGNERYKDLALRCAACIARAALAEAPK